MKSRVDWGNIPGNSARCFLYFLNEINSLGRRSATPSAIPKNCSEINSLRVGTQSLG